MPNSFIQKFLSGMTGLYLNLCLRLFIRSKVYNIFLNFISFNGKNVCNGNFCLSAWSKHSTPHILDFSCFVLIRIVLFYVHGYWTITSCFQIATIKPVSQSSMREGFLPTATTVLGILRTPSTSADPVHCSRIILNILLQKPLTRDLSMVALASCFYKACFYISLRLIWAFMLSTCPFCSRPITSTKDKAFMHICEEYCHN